MNRSQHRFGFTLLELLIVIGILAVLATTAVLVINPIEYVRQTRDTKRIADFVALNKAVQFFSTEKNNPALLGSPLTVYISLPDNASSTCGSYALPALPTGWNYHCASAADLKKINGTGWLPVDLGSISVGSPLSALPVDPGNTLAGAFYYAYTTSGGLWELSVPMESARHMLIGSIDKVSTDGGDHFARYEVGTSLTLSPWNFEFSTFPFVANNSGHEGWYKYAGAGTAVAQSDSEGTFMRASGGQVWLGWQENIPYDSTAVYKIECRARQITEPSVAGAKSIYCGFNGVAADGVTLVNTTGVNTSSSQHYRAFSGTQLVAGAGWTSGVGYASGYGAPNGTSGACNNPAAPCPMHENVRYIRPLILMNYPNGDGVTDIDYIRVTKL